MKNVHVWTRRIIFLLWIRTHSLTKIVITTSLWEWNIPNFSLTNNGGTNPFVFSNSYKLHSLYVCNFLFLSFVMYDMCNITSRFIVQLFGKNYDFMSFFHSYIFCWRPQTGGRKLINKLFWSENTYCVLNRSLILYLVAFHRYSFLLLL